MMTRIVRGAAAGAAAGAAGTTALNAVTYLDMTLRGRDSSSAPARTMESLADKAHLEVPGDDVVRGNRLSAAGALAGIMTGLAVGAAYGMIRALGPRLPLPFAALLIGGAAMIAADGPIALLKVSDPRTWRASDWASDAIPHATYGLATAACAEVLAGHRSGCRSESPG